MRFTINLATRTYLDQALVNRLCYLAVIILLALLGWKLTSAAWNLGEQRKLSADIAQLEARVNRKPIGIREKDIADQKTRIGYYNDIIAQKSFNWLSLLERIEEVTPDGIAITLLTPDPKTGTLKLGGNAKSFALVRSYVENLETAKGFTNVMLTSHTNVIISDEGRGVQFTLSAQVTSP